MITLIGRSKNDAKLLHFLCIDSPNLFENSDVIDKFMILENEVFKAAIHLPTGVDIILADV